MFAGQRGGPSAREATINSLDPAGEILREFLSESREGLAKFEGDVVSLEAAPGDAETVARMFRVIHTIKGTSAMLGLERIAAVAHAGESLLSRLRDGRRTATPDVATALLQLGDALGRSMRSLEEGRESDGEDRRHLVERLTALASGGDAPAAVQAAVSGGTADSSAGPSDDSIRVGVDLLEKLMNLADELVLVRNRIDAAAGRGEADAVRQLDLVTTELQAEVMRLRMQRLAVLWGRLPRMVRDMAVKCGKQVKLELEGEEIELDRAILEAIRDPLVHLLRNAVDHGLETPAGRLQAGKPADGHLALRAAYEGGRVRIELTDDGAGIDPEMVRRTAVAKGLLPAEQAARLAGAELLQLLFRPGFSTAESVTALSGRGVGLDVVKTNVERIGGSVDVISTPGAGTIFAITLPLTLAVLPAIMAEAGEGHYAIPMAGVLELIRWDEGRAIEWIHASPFFRRRGELLPVVSLTGLLAGDARGPALRPEAAGGGLVVVQAGIRRFALMVDRIQDAQEIIVKPRPRHLGTLALYAGSTVLGDGSVALILDLAEVARRARVGAARHVESPVERPAAAVDEARPLLVFQGPDDGRMVMPLELVGRVERMPSSAVENSGALEVVQHRGSVIPLIRVAEAIVERRRLPRRTSTPEAGADLVVVVLEREGRRVGLVVNHVTDIVRERLTVDRPAGREGVLGSAIVGREVAEVFDIEGAIRRRDPQFYGAAPHPMDAGRGAAA